MRVVVHKELYRRREHFLKRKLLEIAPKGPRKNSGPLFDPIKDFGPPLDHRKKCWPPPQTDAPLPVKNDSSLMSSFSVRPPPNSPKIKN